MQVRSNILQGSYRFEPDDIWRLVSPQAILFIKSLLVTDPKVRPTAQAAQKHDWFAEWARRRARSNGEGPVPSLNPNVVRALVNFKEFSDMRKLLCEVLSFTLLPDQIRDLRREFEKMDTDGSGEISLVALKQVLMQNAGAGSLGALTEEEVTDIFDAMRVSKTETRIHWHEFIAAGLSQCSVDDRNLRLAFERLDADHKGYITLDDIMDLMGSDALQSEEALRRMWGDSIKAVKCQHARITYDDFLLLMKGQTREGPHPGLKSPGQSLRSLTDIPGNESLRALPSKEMMGDAVPPGRRTEESRPKYPAVPPMPNVRPPGVAGSMSAPATPSDRERILDDDERDSLLEGDLKSPLSMDVHVPKSAHLTPPMTPLPGVNEKLSPRLSPQADVNYALSLSSPSTLKPLTAQSLALPDMPKGAPAVRIRSRSLGNSSDDPADPLHPSTSAFSDVSDDASGDLNAMADTFRDLMLPETDHGSHIATDLEDVVKDKSKSALVVNRHLYRAHRQMRMAVLEASKRFEEQQAEHARDLILAQREENEKQNPQTAIAYAGLVMRHGHSKQVSSEAIRAMLKKERAEQKSLVAQETRRSGRRRSKTVSALTGMFSMGSDDFGVVAAQANSNDNGRTSLGSSAGLKLRLSDSVGTKRSADLAGMEQPNLGGGNRNAGDKDQKRKVHLNGKSPEHASNELCESNGNGKQNGDKPKEGPTRAPTVPGNFKKTYDPFGSQGKYGAGMSGWS